MAAASGPVETSSGKSEEEQVEELKLPEAPSPMDNGNDTEHEKSDFKVPVFSGDSTESDSSRKRDDESSASKTEKKALDLGKPKKSVPVLSPAEQLKHTQVSIPYKEPIWGGTPPESAKYSLDVLKNGTVIENIELGKKPWVVIGRLPSCDVCMEHPSLSRHHAVVQYRDTEEEGKSCGWYLYDLDSTHGTWVNKVKVKPKVYHRLYVGHVLKFGGSSRLFVLQGPEEEMEAESTESVSELRQRTERLRREAAVIKEAERREVEDAERRRQGEADSCSWGMGDDATDDSEETPLTVLVPQHEHLYSDDPKKALKGFYEREGCDLPDYQFTEVGYGKHKCIVELPVDGRNGEVLVAEATVSGRRKDAVVACAREACRLLDIHGLLHADRHESRKRKARNWEEDDFYDSDEDTFLDRTGTIERKRLYRMHKAGREQQAETYDSLLPKHKEVQTRIEEIELKLEQAKAQAAAMEGGDGEDALEAYMMAIRAGVMDTRTRLALKRELLTLRTELARLARLLALARPAHLPPVNRLEGGVKPAKRGLTTGLRKISAVKGPPRAAPPTSKSCDLRSKEGEEEEEEEEEEEKGEDAKATLPCKSGSEDKLGSEDTAPSLPLVPQSKAPPSQSKTPPPKTQAPPPKTQAPSPKTQAPPPKTKAPPPKTQASTPQSQFPAPRTLPPKVTSHRETGPQRKTGPYSLADVGRQGEQPTEEQAAVQFLPQKESRMNKRMKKSSACMKGEYDASDPDYAVWMPPEGQSGDGRTSLNDKLGY